MVAHVVRVAAPLYRVHLQGFGPQAPGFVEWVPVRRSVEGSPAWRAVYHAAQASAQQASVARWAACFAATHPDHAVCSRVYHAARCAVRCPDHLCHVQAPSHPGPGRQAAPAGSAQADYQCFLQSVCRAAPMRDRLAQLPVAGQVLRFALGAQL